MWSRREMPARGPSRRLAIRIACRAIRRIAGPIDLGLVFAAQAGAWGEVL